MGMKRVYHVEEIAAIQSRNKNNWRRDIRSWIKEKLSWQLIKEKPSYILTTFWFQRIWIIDWTEMKAD